MTELHNIIDGWPVVSATIQLAIHVEYGGQEYPTYNKKREN